MFRRLPPHAWPAHRVLHALCLAIAAKAPETYRHAQRVSAYFLLLAEKVYGGLSPQHARDVACAGLLHDLGKLYLPERILEKPGRLTPAEAALLRRHPRLGAETLAAIPGLAQAVSVALHHHERYDGRGYPDGLRGEHIPLDARIAALADAFDAMTSARPYRSPLSLDAALGEMVAARGSQFDPELVALFVRHFDSIRRLYYELHAPVRQQSGVMFSPLVL
ncbi:hypothetical protein GCM10010885_06230 [Alicyclobacillus cellulosilyticus]|uniref:HD-GYP domain-containing protein n=1 Tax=Alicyclobacillus cellulosilyticus TaxID=1003997 RepID=A0A917NGM6_9BACL|nr:HD-GYP domain-containing protein [Alicyclobacillus cellulosilyticus]GGI99668.1 hypothetical protein GCM10010885_06230 [Alicyclobacillus cellulosilyticus]